MILSVSLVNVDDKPALMCRVGTSRQTPMPNLEQAFQNYEQRSRAGSRIILLHAADPRDGAKAALRHDIIRRFDAVAVFRHEESGFRVVSHRAGGPYKKYEVIHRDKIVTVPTHAAHRA